MNINENRFLFKPKIVMCQLLREIPEFTYKYWYDIWASNVLS